MKFPNKVTSYSESVLSKFPVLLKQCEKEPMPLADLYRNTKDVFSGVDEFLGALSCLYALNKIKLDEETERIYYVI